MESLYLEIREAKQFEQTNTIALSQSTLQQATVKRRKRVRQSVTQSLTMVEPCPQSLAPLLRQNYQYDARPFGRRMLTIDLSELRIRSRTCIICLRGGVPYGWPLFRSVYGSFR